MHYLFILKFLFIFKNNCTLQSAWAWSHLIWPWSRNDMQTLILTSCGSFHPEENPGVLSERTLWEAMGIERLWSAIPLPAQTGQSISVSKIIYAQTVKLLSSWCRLCSRCPSFPGGKCTPAHLSFMAFHLAWVTYIPIVTEIKIPTRSLGDLPG